MAECSRARREGPDQGYAWVVALACFFMNFLLVGLARSVAVMYVALVETYGVTREQATLPFSIRVSLKNLAGPLIGLLGQKYGIRRISTVGGFVAALGSFLCYFAPSVLWITIFWGLIHGIGYGLSTLIHMVIINHYFDKYKATALGLAYSGDCFGTFAFPIIMEYLLETYDVRGTFLILSGIILNTVPMAMLLKKPPWQRKPRKSSKSVIERNLSEDKTNRMLTRESLGYRNESFLKFDEDLNPFQGHEDKYCKYNEAFGYDNPSSINRHSIKDHRINNWKQEMSSISGSIRSHRTLSDMSDKRTGSLKTVYEKEVTINQHETSEVSLDDRSETDLGQTERGTDRSTSIDRRKSSVVSQIAHDIVQKMRSGSFASQIVQDGFIAVLQPEETESEEVPSEIVPKSTIQSYRNDLQNGSLDSFNRNGGGQELILSANDMNLSDGGISPIPEQNTETRRPSILMLLFQTNLKPIFILISMSMAVFVYSFIGVLMIVIDYAGDQGVPHHQAKFLIIGLSVGDLIGRLSFGQIIDRKLIKIKNYAGVSLLLMGVVIASVPFNTSFTYMIVCMSLFGLVLGGGAIMFPILVNYYMDKNEEAVAMGSLNFYGGILMLSMAPMIGYFRDNVGSYNGVFHIYGGILAFVGIVWQFEPLILKFQNKQKQNQQDWVIVTRL